MSPTPTDVSYRTANAMDRGPAHANTPGAVKGLREEHMGVSADNRASRLNGNASNSAQALPTGGTGNGVGPGNMSSGISVQELKQMTALRMAQEQGHLRVVSPFPYVIAGRQQGQLGSRAPSPARAGIDAGREASRLPGIMRTASTKSVGSNISDNPRVRRHSISVPDSSCNAANGGSATGGGISGASRTGNGGDIPPTPPSSSGSSRGGGARRRSPSPSGRGSSPTPPAPPASSSSRASPITSSMPHGLTVQELKELTKMRLAKEAFNIPVYAVLQASAHHRTRTLSPGGANGSNAAPGARGPGLRGRGHSPAAGSRSPVARGRSTPSSPDHERGGERPHRRTRRGGRRGRNRSPRPDGQYSPSLSARLGSTTGSTGGGPGSRDGYSSTSPSPRDRRAHTGGWSETDEQLHPRSSSQPRSMTADPSFQPSDTRFAVNESRRLVGRASDPSGRAGDREGALQLSGGSASPPHLDVYGGAGGSDGGGVRAFGDSNGQANTGGAIAGNGGLSEAFPVHGPGRSVVTRHLSGGPHGHEHRSRRRGSPPADVGSMHEAERRRREGVGARDVVDRRGGPLDGRENRVTSHDRSRSQHTDRMYMGAGGGGGLGFDDMPQFREREDVRRGHLMGSGSDRTVLRGHNPRDEAGSAQYRIHRSVSETVASLGGSRARLGDARASHRAAQVVHQTSPGVSPHIRPRDLPGSHQQRLSRQLSVDPKLTSSGSACSTPLHLNAGGFAGRSPAHGPLKGGEAATGGEAGAGSGKGGGYEFDYLGSLGSGHHGGSHQQRLSQHGASLQRAGSSSSLLGSAAPGQGHSLVPADFEGDQKGYPYDSHGFGGNGHSPWNSSRPPHSPFTGSRQGQRQGRNGAGNDSNGAGYSGGGPMYTGAERSSSFAGSLSEGYRDDISHTVAESVLVTPKTPGGSAHWRNSQSTAWQSQSPSSGVLSSPASLPHERDHGAYTPHGHHSTQLYGSSAHRAADDRSTSGSNDSFPPLRREVSLGGGHGSGSSGSDALRGQSQHQHRHQHQHQHDASFAPRQLRGESRVGRSQLAGSGMASFGAGAERYDYGNRRDDGDDSDMNVGAYLSSSGPSSLGMGLGQLRGGANSADRRSPVSSQSPLLPGARFPGSAPSAFEREPFPLLSGEPVGISALKSALDAGYSDSLLEDASSRLVGSRKSQASPVLSALSPKVGSLASSTNDGRHTPLNSPLMSGLKISLDLGGYGTASEHHPYPLATSTRSEGAGSAHSSDFPRSEVAGSDGIASVVGGGPTPVLQSLEGGSIVGDTGSSSSPASLHDGSSRDDPFLRQQGEIVSMLGDTGASTLQSVHSFFSYNASQDDAQSFSAGVEGITARLQNSSLSPTNSAEADGAGAVGEQKQGQSGPGPIGSSRASTTQGSTTSSPRDIVRIHTPPLSSSSPVPSSRCCDGDGDGAGTPPPVAPGSTSVSPSASASPGATMGAASASPAPAAASVTEDVSGSFA